MIGVEIGGQVDAMSCASDNLLTVDIGFAAHSPKLIDPYSLELAFLA